MTNHARRTAVLTVILLTVFCLLVVGPAIQANEPDPTAPPPPDPPPPGGNSLVGPSATYTPILPVEIFSPMAMLPGF